MSQPSREPCDPRRFYHQRFPAQFNRTFEGRQRAAEGGDAAALRLLEGMRTVNATLAIIVKSDAGDERFNLNVRAGRMSQEDEPAHPPFMTLLHDRGTLAVLERESGDSVLDFLGAIAGMEHEMFLTSQRVQNLHQLEGSLRFSLTGENALEITAHFGDGAPAGSPSCSITIDGDAYRELRTGRLAPQDAFMSGRVQVEGDMQMAMQLALAVVSPE